MTKQRIEFTGRSQDDISNFGPDITREMFINKFMTDLYKIVHPDKIEFLNSDPEAYCNIPGNNVVYTICVEMIKNIHDHNGGWGYCELEVTADKFISFEIGNLSNPTPETNEHSPETRQNYSRGLKLLRTMLEHGIIIAINIDGGYIYKGFYDPARWIKKS